MRTSEAHEEVVRQSLSVAWSFAVRFRGLSSGHWLVQSDQIQRRVDLAYTEHLWKAAKESGLAKERSRETAVLTQGNSSGLL